MNGRLDHNDIESDCDDRNIDNDNDDNNRIMMTKMNRDCVKEHWYLLGKNNMQSNIIHQMFYYMLIEYPHIRPIWLFSRSLIINESNDNWKEKLKNDFQFRYVTD